MRDKPQSKHGSVFRRHGTFGSLYPLSWVWFILDWPVLLVSVSQGEDEVNLIESKDHDLGGIGIFSSSFMFPGYSTCHQLSQCMLHFV